MAEYVLREDDDQGEIARLLLEQAGDRAREIKWLPRPGYAHGGVFSVPDDLADGLESGRLNRVDDSETEAEAEGAEAESEPASRPSRAAARRAAKAGENKE